MRVVCSWCNTFLAHALPLDDQRTTHGICRTCSELFLADDTAQPYQVEGGPNAATRDREHAPTRRQA